MSDVDVSKTGEISLRQGNCRLMADDLLSVELLLTCLVASLVAYFFFSSSRSRPSTELPAPPSAALEDAPLPGVSVGPMPPLPGAPHLLLRRDALVTKVRDCLVASKEEEGVTV